MTRYPIVGVGPDNFPNFAHEYGFRSGKKEAHSLWLQQGAELGIPGFIMFIWFYVITIKLMWRLLTFPDFVDPWYADIARMVISSLAGFAMAAMFVSVETLEVPYYLVLLGAGALRVVDQGTAYIEETAETERRRDSMAYA
jgi:O-antigen ligase